MVLRRLSAIVLLLALFGAHPALESVCSAFCTGAMRSESHHHDHAQMRMDMSGTSHHDVKCTECPRIFGKTVMQRSECSNFDQILNLQEGSTTVSASAATSQLNVPQPAQSPELPITFEQRSQFLFPPRSNPIGPLAVSLRV